MGYYYSAQCTDQTCSGGCCNGYGVCPDYNSFDSFANSCFYTYRYVDKKYCDPKISSGCCFSQIEGSYQCSSDSMVGVIVGAVVGSVVLFVGIAVLIVCIVRKHKQDLLRGNGTTAAVIEFNAGHGQNRIIPIQTNQLNRGVFSSPQKMGQNIYSQPVDMTYLQQIQQNSYTGMMGH